MSTLILADLHLDFWLSQKRDPLENVAREDLDRLDAVILAGDITNKGVPNWKHALQWLSERIDPGKIYMVPGNHDYYSGRVDRDDKLEAICIEAGANFAQQREVVVGRDRFLCCTLWTDMAYGRIDPTFHRWRAEQTMNDFRSIRVEAQGYRRLYAAYAATIHDQHRAWLSDRLDRPFDGRSFVVSHHAPLPNCMYNPNEDFACAYVSDLSNWILDRREKGQLDGWIYGHTHFQGPSDFDGMPILCASLGYPMEVKKTPEAPGIWIEAPPAPRLSGPNP